MQTLISKEATFSEGIKVLLEMQNSLFAQITSIVNTFPPEAFYQLPFGQGDKNHNSTLTLSLWHLFRIEDIVAHTLILNNRQILFENNWLERTNCPIITTGNELDGEAMIDFSKKLNVKALYEYCKAVMDSTNELLKSLRFSGLKRKFSVEDKEMLIAGECVSDSDSASWLIDFWRGKNVKGLIQMPFSRHWIMHVLEDNRLLRQAQ